jgi:hypothetical protein
VAGHLSTFSSLVEHEGYPTTEGQRMILVGFLDVVPYDEDGITPTGLSLFASWLNWNWMLARVVDYIEKYKWQTEFWKKVVKKVIKKFVNLLDRYTTHAMTAPLVEHEQLPELIQTLENSYNHTNRVNKARWIEGQQKKQFTKYINDWFYEDETNETEVKVDIVSVEAVGDEL